MKTKDTKNKDIERGVKCNPPKTMAVQSGKDVSQNRRTVLYLKRLHALCVPIHRLRVMDAKLEKRLRSWPSLVSQPSQGPVGRL